MRISYTTVCPLVRGDNPRALASGLSPVQADKHGITILYYPQQYGPCPVGNISSCSLLFLAEVAKTPGNALFSLNLELPHTVSKLYSRS